jgi:hypothetical protein
MHIQHGTVVGSVKRRSKSKHKQSAIRNNCGIAAWRLAAAEHLRKGKFIHLPKRGTPEHAAMRARQQELLPVVRAQIEEEERVAAEAERIARHKRNQAMQARAVANYERRKAADAASASLAVTANGDGGCESSTVHPERAGDDGMDDGECVTATGQHRPSTNNGVSSEDGACSVSPVHDRARGNDTTSCDDELGVEVVDDWI